MMVSVYVVLSHNSPAVRKFVCIITTHILISSAKLFFSVVSNFFVCVKNVLQDVKVGKTSFIYRHLTGDYEESYNATIGVEVFDIDFVTNKL